jgi:hypothetical protein
MNKIFITQTPMQKEANLCNIIIDNGEYEDCLFIKIDDTYEIRFWEENRLFRKLKDKRLDIRVSEIDNIKINAIMQRKNLKNTSELIRQLIEIEYLNPKR